MCEGRVNVGCLCTSAHFCCQLTTALNHEVYLLKTKAEKKNSSF